jgi:pimeloyl-ACP methyl ester carboxylesterase
VARARTPEGATLAAGLWRSFAEPDHDLRGQANRVEVPTLIVWGSRDTAIPLPLGRATHRRLPRARFVTLPTGHVPFASAPDAFLAHVGPFLSR